MGQGTELQKLYATGKKVTKKAYKSMQALLAKKRKKKKKSKINYGKVKRVDIYSQGQKRKKMMEAAGDYNPKKK